MGWIRNFTNFGLATLLSLVTSACGLATPTPTPTYTPRPSPTATIKPSPTSITTPTATATPIPSPTPRLKYYLSSPDVIASIIEIDGEKYFILPGPSLTNRPTDYLGRNPCPNDFIYRESIERFGYFHECMKRDEPYKDSVYIDKYVDISFSHHNEIISGEEGLDMYLFGSVFWQDRESRNILHELFFSAELTPKCEIVGYVELKSYNGVPPGEYASEFVRPLLDKGKYLCNSLKEAGIIDWWLTNKSYVKSE